MTDEATLQALRQHYEAHHARPLPRLGGRGSEFDDMDVSLFEEDAYLAGLTQSVLRRRSIELREILINQTIDERIESAPGRHGDGDERLLAFASFRQSMLVLADLLARASGIPVVRWTPRTFPFLVVDTHGEISIYSSDRLESHLEAIDVRNDEFRVFDCHGTEYELSAESDSSPVTLGARLSGVANFELVRELAGRHLAAIRRAGRLGDIPDLSTPEAVEEALRPWADF